MIELLIYPMFMHGWGRSFGYGFGGPFMMIFGLLFWVAVIIGVVILVRYLASQGNIVQGVPQAGVQLSKTDEAIDILRERYAKGEINKEEFEEKMKVLKSQ